MKKILETLKQKWAEYLLEIIVIMFGILGAFTLNNWNEERKNRKLEIAYLKNVNEEFKGNLIQFNQNLEEHLEIAESCDSLQASFPITIDNWESFKNNIIRVLRGKTFDPSYSSIESLINSSSIDIISNAELKILLLSWPKTLEDWKEEEIMLTVNIEELGRWVSKNVDHYDDFRLVNPELLFELQNSIMSRCYWQTLIINDPETKRLVNVMESIITMSDPYVE